MTKQHSQSSVKFTLFTVIASLCFLILNYLLYYNRNIQEESLSAFVIVLSILEIVILLVLPRIIKTGFAVTFFLYNVLCINGFVVALYFDESYLFFRSITATGYVYNRFYHEAILISNIVLLAFVFGVMYESFKISIIPYQKKELVLEDHSRINEDEKLQLMDLVGIMSVLSGLAIIMFFAFKYNLFFKKYVDILSVTTKYTIVQYAVILASLGIVFLIGSGSKKGLKIGIPLFFINILLHFSIGNRGEVLYATVVAFALYSMMHKINQFKYLLPTVLFFVITIPLVRIIREDKIDDYSVNLSQSILDVLSEEGFQISSFTYIVEKVHRSGHVWGMTYVTYFTDFIMRQIGLNSPLVKIDSYVIKSIMPYTGMGFSMAGELYYNFTILGACIFYFIFGRIMCGVDWRIFTKDEHLMPSEMFFSLLMVEMINLTRNDSSTLPLYMFFIISYSTLYYFYRKRLKHQDPVAISAPGCTI